MSRRHLVLAVAALTSLVVTACSSAPTAPEPSALRVKAAPSADALTDTTSTVDRSGWSGGHG